MEILILAFLILINGFFALSEIALVSSKKSRLEHKKLEGSRGAKFALKLLDNSEGFLSAIQVGITLIGIVTGVYGGINLAGDLAPIIQNIEPLKAFAGEIALLITVVLITYFSIVIGELVPKTVALSNPEKIAVRVAPIIFYFSTVFYPFVKILSFSTNFINKLIGIKKTNDHITEKELRQIIKNASVVGVIEKEQNTLHEKVFYFSDKKAKHLMTHRTDIEWIDIERKKDEIKSKLLKVRHNKIICAQGSLDNFKGIIYLKDFYKQIYEHKEFNIQAIIKEPLIVPDNADAQNVLDLFRQNKVQICCVVNEYGGFEGLITLYDIVENIVGHVPDLGISNEPNIFIRDDKSILVSGDAPIEILEELINGFNVDFDYINYSTVAGFMFDKLGKIPQMGDKFVFLKHVFEVIDIDGAKIDKILITKVVNQN